MPDYGYFGTNSPMKKIELKDMISEMEKKIISQHIFMLSLIHI